jgi:hypothetical protein
MVPSPGGQAIAAQLPGRLNSSPVGRPAARRLPVGPATRSKAERFIKGAPLRGPCDDGQTRARHGSKL